MLASEYNASVAGKLWHVEQLPEALRVAWHSSPQAFASRVAELQRLAGLPEDGKLGPNTLKRVGGVSAPAAKVLGIDVSGWQPIDHFSERDFARSEVGFAYVKTSEGESDSNKYAAEQTSLFHTWGIAVGFYHFGRVDLDPLKQADILCERGASLARSMKLLPYALDLEWHKKHNTLPDAAFRTWAGAFLRRLKDNDGRAPVLYSGPSFWKEHVAGRLDAEYLLWTVDYSHPEAPPTLPPGHSSWIFRQWTGKGRLSIYDGDLDLNYFNGTMPELQKLLA